MTNEDLEGNKLIAEFMGFEYDRSLPGHGGTIIKTLGIEDCRYYTSWDWLMPVVEKIENTKDNFYYGFTVRIIGKYCSVVCHEKGKQDGVIYQTPYGVIPESKINSVWLAVVEFIKWHNHYSNACKIKMD